MRSPRTQPQTAGESPLNPQTTASPHANCPTANFAIKLAESMRTTDRKGTPRAKFKSVVIACLSDQDADHASVMADHIISTFWTNGVIAMRPKRPADSDWRFAWSDRDKFYREVPTEDGFVGFHPSMFELVELRRSKRGPAY
jgi:hypothetical protein